MLKDLGIVILAVRSYQYIYILPWGKKTYNILYLILTKNQ